MTMTSKELVRLLKRNGWYSIKQEGYLLDLERNGFNYVIVPIHNKDLPKGLLIKILKQTGLN